MKERKLALTAKGRLKELLAEKGLRIEWSGAVDKTPTHRPPIKIYRSNSEEIGKRLLQEGHARTWNPKRRNDWCSRSF
jgi:endonuclease YncB( thermonuclease family)